MPASDPKKWVEMKRKHCSAGIRDLFEGSLQDLCDHPVRSFDGISARGSLRSVCKISRPLRKGLFSGSLQDKPLNKTSLEASLQDLCGRSLAEEFCNIVFKEHFPSWKACHSMSDPTDTKATEGIAHARRSAAKAIRTTVMRPSADGSHAMFNIRTKPQRELSPAQSPQKGSLSISKFAPRRSPSNPSRPMCRGRVGFRCATIAPSRSESDPTPPKSGEGSAPAIQHT